MNKKTESKLSTLISEYQENRKQELNQIYQAEKRKKQKQEPIQKVKVIESKEIDE